MGIYIIYNNAVSLFQKKTRGNQISMSFRYVIFNRKKSLEHVFQKLLRIEKLNSLQNIYIYSNDQNQRLYAY